MRMIMRGWLLLMLFTRICWGKVAYLRTGSGWETHRVLSWCWFHHQWQALLSTKWLTGFELWTWRIWKILFFSNVEEKNIWQSDCDGQQHVETIQCQWFNISKIYGATICPQVPLKPLSKPISCMFWTNVAWDHQNEIGLSITLRVSF